jgi:peptide-methionine (S)-S-oxide reductase
MMARALLAVAAVFLFASVVASGTSSLSGVDKPVGQTEKAQPSDKGLAKATFAGGCFWCMEGPFDELDGVVSTTSGYTGGRTRNPSYEEVSAGGTGHAEAVEIVYDPAKISYERLLDVFWRNVDPLDNGGQFCDRGSHYRTAIFVHNAEQRAAAERSKAALQSSGRLHGKIVTEIVDRAAFYRAEEYHQDYYLTNPLRYKYYRFSCGRDRRLKALWGEAATH